MSSTPAVPRARGSLVRRAGRDIARRQALKAPRWAPPRQSEGSIRFDVAVHHVEPGAAVTVAGIVELPAGTTPDVGRAWVPVFSGFLVGEGEGGGQEIEVREGRFSVDVRALEGADGACSTLVVTIGNATARAQLTTETAPAPAPESR